MPGNTERELIEIGPFVSEFEAQVAKAHLAADGIEARMVTDDAGGTIPAMSALTSGVRLILRAEDAEAAREVLRTAEVTDDDKTDNASDG